MTFDNATPGGAPRWDGCVDRPRLRTILDAGEKSALTLVVAPAGWGKTVLLTDWASSTAARVCWIDLEEFDNDPGHLVRKLHGGLHRAVGELPGGLSSRMDFLTPAMSPGRAEEVAHALAESGEIVVVVDDLHLLVDALSVATIQRFVEATPDNVRLVLATRHDPPLPLARLRVTGSLTEIRQTDLAFTTTEASSLLQSQGTNLEPDVFQALTERTEGWAAALRLAEFSMHRSAHPARMVRELAGTNMFMSNYLVEEVLKHADADDIGFVMRTSILDEVNEDLAETLTERRDGAAVLERLVSSGMFTIRTSSPGGFRYHHLFRDLMRSRLYETDAPAVPGLHRKAARWLHEHDEPVAAIGHAIDAGDVDDATAWLGAAATGLMSTGHSHTVAELSGRVRQTAAEPGDLLLMTRLWALYNLGHEHDELDPLFDTLIGRLERRKPEREPGTRVHGGDPRSFVDRDALPWLIGAQARSHGDLHGLVGLDEPENLPSPSGRVEAWVGEGYLWAEEFERAGELLAVYDAHAQHDQYPPSLVHASGLRALAFAKQGQFPEADMLIDYAMSIVGEFGIGHLLHAMYAQLAQSYISFERGQLAQSEA
ncbi:MAG: hypothetical protein ACR2OH_07385, partial [Microthrixaceae bacterium]